MQAIIEAKVSPLNLTPYGTLQICLLLILLLYLASNNNYAECIAHTFT